MACELHKKGHVKLLKKILEYEKNEDHSCIYSVLLRQDLIDMVTRQQLR